MEMSSCEVCLGKKTALRCSLCSKFSCKHCIEFIDDSVFEFQELLPETLKDKAFCPNCFDEKISDQLAEYSNIMQLAKNINVYGKEQSSETRLMRRVKKPIKIEQCDDREETLLRLAYLAAQQGFDTIVDVDLVSKKVNQGGRYKKLVWSGSATPIDSSKR